ncbi:MAG: SusC/RagA family TonB-linked outer membrane protein [Bacteroidetes bacterium]|nr:SusC/RagA family TonB-linked outer membrane protein [Bacteroidota bacterium]
MMIKRVYKNLKSTMLLFLWLVCSVAVLAQDRQITGTVKDANGAGLPGVSVVVKGTTSGTTTNAEGKYSINAPSNATLVLSFIGYVTQEAAVGNRGSVDITLAEDVMQLGEVVVTALGVERSQKALQSSITKVPGMSLTAARENNVGNSMQGRVAGVNVTKSSSGPAGSSRVIIRGNKSIGGSNQPLYVIDGIPMDNTQFGQVGVWGGTDQGDGLTSLNPEDIESVTVLKGAAAAALYGSRGGFGVINITTKRGSNKKGLGIEFNSNYVFEKVYRYDDTQTIYGPGGLKANPADPTGPQIYAKPISQLEAWNWGNGAMWGPKFDGSMVPQFDGVSRPYSYAGDNWSRFYETGSSWTNSLAITGGGNNQTFRFSFSDMKDTFVVPNSSFGRKNAALSTNGKFGKKITYNAKVMYSNEKMNNRSMLGDSPGNAPYAIYGLATNTNVMDLMGDPNKPGAVPVGVTTPDLKSTGEEYQQANNNWCQNPWWAAYQITNENIRDRFITSANLRYNILDWLYIQGQIGMDYAVRNSNSLVPQGTGYQRGGSKSETGQFQREINQEWTMGADHEFGKIRVTGFVGGNKMTREYERIAASGSNFNVPFFTSVNNTSSQSFSYGYSKSGINSLFYSAEVSYAGYLYLTTTGREDWFSVLNPANNHKFYPSVGGSFVFTDAFSTLPEWLSFGKLRAAWGQVATANVGSYAVVPTYGLLGQGHLSLPMGTFAFGDNIPNPNLNPALSSEIEFGTDLKFLNGRAGVEFTYYTQKTTDDILSATISQSSGFNSTSVNIGELTNKGIEILVSGTPVQKGDFSWDISVNIAHNENKIVTLAPGVTRLFIDEPRTRNAGVYQVAGMPFGMILGYIQKVDPASGKKVYDANGYPVRSDVMEILGNGIAKVTGGLSNTFRYKRFTLDALIDYKFGGDIYSGTEVNLTSWGLHKQTLEYREGGMPIEGVIQTGTEPMVNQFMVRYQ